MATTSRVQIHQYNDPEILEFLTGHGIEFDLVGDHMFIFHTPRGGLAAGPGDWLVAGTDGELRVERGEHARRAQRAIEKARKARRKRSKAVPGAA